MKPFEQLNNVERARLLHQLFPGEIPALIQTMKNISGNIIDHPEFFPQIGEEVLCTPGARLAIASSIHNRLTKYTNRLNRSSRLFSDQLFDGGGALFSFYCLHEHLKQKTYLSLPFKQAVELFF